MALLLSRRDVQNLLGMADAIRIVEEAFRQLALGQVLMPQRSVIHVGPHGGVYLGMPAYIGGAVDALAIKVVTVYANNPTRHNLPTTIGTLLLNDPRTGAPLAVMEAGYLTAVRTGAVSGVATKHLARPNATRVGVFGAGVQARAQLQAVCAVRKIQSAAVYDSDGQRAREYAREMGSQLKLLVTAVDTPRAAVEGMDIILTASSAGQPIFDGAWLAPGQHINGVGSHSPKARELDTATIVRSKVVPDFPDACLAEAGDLLIPLSEGAITKAHLHAGLGEVVAGLKPGRENDQEITLFKSVGLALQDVATASFVYKKALETHTGVEFSF
ncbi:MAG TPA: ornithine cyclodeaminase family protein [Candidatus Sulfotelmatobacter sp.]|nr:ornithine cyclodeaminase family protein [Candidatus Sulfotelmatobacter sp.]